MCFIIIHGTLGFCLLSYLRMCRYIIKSSQYIVEDMDMADTLIWANEVKGTYSAKAGRRKTSVVEKLLLIFLFIFIIVVIMNMVWFELFLVNVGNYGLQPHCSGDADYHCSDNWIRPASRFDLFNRKLIT